MTLIDWLTYSNKRNTADMYNYAVPYLRILQFGLMLLNARRAVLPGTLSGGRVVQRYNELHHESYAQAIIMTL